MSKNVVNFSLRLYVGSDTIIVVDEMFTGLGRRYRTGRKKGVLYNGKNSNGESKHPGETH